MSYLGEVGSEEFLMKLTSQITEMVSAKITQGAFVLYVVDHPVESLQCTEEIPSQIISHFMDFASHCHCHHLHAVQLFSTFLSASSSACWPNALIVNPHSHNSTRVISWFSARMARVMCFTTSKPIMLRPSNTSSPVNYAITWLTAPTRCSSNHEFVIQTAHRIRKCSSGWNPGPKWPVCITNASIVTYRKSRLLFMMMMTRRRIIYFEWNLRCDNSICCNHNSCLCCITNGYWLLICLSVCLYIHLLYWFIHGGVSV